MRSEIMNPNFIVHSSNFRFKNTPHVLRIIFWFLLLTPYCLLLTTQSSLANTGIKDRVVAFVDNSAITLSELEMKYEETLKITPDITRDEVLNTMVNRLLLLKEARKMRLEAATEDALLKEYIDLKIRAFIRIKEEELTDFYNKHINEFEGKEFEAVRDDIEKYLTEKELNERLKSHINELRENACIKIQLNEDFRN
jgi:hypothetical protein